MRLWSLHPKYLDNIGLIACWREGLLARKVLLGETKGYKNHPQLIRFKKLKDPIKALDSYLFWILKESENRGYNFTKNKIDKFYENIKIDITKNQIEYEFEFLKRKLIKRNPYLYNNLIDIENPESNPIFNIIEGEIEEWEKVQ
ncbi:MAG: hypothetical protein IMY73_00890 [Bacteroidetes bacterium]|nr:hypothetical protein [Bacteroidota bacterium]